jgi:hypothetical protein
VAGRPLSQATRQGFLYRRLEADDTGSFSSFSFLCSSYTQGLRLILRWSCGQGRPAQTADIINFIGKFPTRDHHRTISGAVHSARFRQT